MSTGRYAVGWEYHVRVDRSPRPKCEVGRLASKAFQLLGDLTLVAHDAGRAATWCKPEIKVRVKVAEVLYAYREQMSAKRHPLYAPSRRAALPLS
jgi:hypothetical protein